MPFVPNPVTHTSSRLLEFETLRDLLAGYASSPLGQRRIAELQPSLDPSWIETQQQLTTEIREPGLSMSPVKKSHFIETNPGEAV